MISHNDMTAVGRLLKPHGINGELVVMVDRDIPQWEDVRCILLDIDGIPVPFFINSSREKSTDTDLIKLEGVESEKEASLLCGKTVYLLKSDLVACMEEDGDYSDGFYADDLIGFSCRTDDGKILGKISGLDTSTPNYLFLIESPDGGEVLVPATGEFIVEVDTVKREVVFSLPEGLIE